MLGGNVILLAGVIGQLVALGRGLSAAACGTLVQPDEIAQPSPLIAARLPMTESPQICRIALE
jgi:hypothetical protein